MYKLIKANGVVSVVLRLSDMMSIPLVEGNRDYQEYLAWVAEGNTPEPADE
jgi:hypothetical protein